METPDDDRLNEAALRAHDDAALEAVRFELARDGDHRLGQVVRVLAVRAVPVVIRTWCTLGARRGVSGSDIGRAITDATARLEIRLRRPEHLLEIDRLASSIAVACVEAQPVGQSARPKLAPRAPDLRLIEGLRDGTIRPNDAQMS